MIWHIVKKDWKLMWPYAAGFAAWQFAEMFVLLGIGRFHAVPFIWLNTATLARLGPGDRAFYSTSLAAWLSYFAAAFLITTIVQQDAIPGVRQDWLVRPIRRRDLLLAKVLGVILMALGPIFLADLCGALLNGFPWGASMSAAAGRAVWLWFTSFLIVFALATLTKNLLEAIVAGTVGAGAYLLIPMVRQFWQPQPFFFVHGRTDWMDQLVHFAIILAGAAVVLGLQYFLRKTFESRLVTAGFGFALLLVPAVPWQTALAIEQRMSPNPAAANGVSISFVAQHETPQEGSEGPMPYDRAAASVMLPIRVSGLPDEAILFGDYSAIRIIGPDGREINDAHARLQIGMPTLRVERADPNKPITYVMEVPRDVYSRIADQPVRLEIDYQLTLLKLADMQALPAIGGNQRTGRLGWCGTKLSEAGGEIQLGCISTVEPSCLSIELVYPPTGARNPRSGVCAQPNYSPIRLDYGADALSRFTEGLPFGSANGIDQYPIKEPMLPQSQVIVKMYEPEDHFERRLVIPQIRLRDWSADN